MTWPRPPRAGPSTRVVVGSASGPRPLCARGTSAFSPREERGSPANLAQSGKAAQWLAPIPASRATPARQPLRSEPILVYGGPARPAVAGSSGSAIHGAFPAIGTLVRRPARRRTIRGWGGHGMHASRFALVDLALGVVLLGLLPAGRAPTSGERETPRPAAWPAFRRASSRGPSASGGDRDVRAIQRWQATKQRLLGEAEGVTEPVPARAGAAWLATTEAPAASGPGEAGRRREEPRTEARSSACDAKHESAGRLRQAELRLSRLLASEKDRAGDRAEPGQEGSEASLLDELARLISWKQRPDKRADVATRGRRASAASPSSAPRVRY